MHSAVHYHTHKLTYYNKIHTKVDLVIFISGMKIAYISISFEHRYLLYATEIFKYIENATPLSVLTVAQSDRFQLKKLLPAASASTAFSICKRDLY